MGLRQRKQALITSLNGHVLAGLITKTLADEFEARYRRCRSESEQEIVRQDIIHVVSGYAHNPQTVYDKLRSAKPDIEDEDDEDPPALKAALERARVRLR